MYFPVLAPQVLTNVISQQAAVAEWILNLFGLNIGGDAGDPLFDSENDVAKGANVLNFGHGRRGEFNVINNSRKVASGRAPGAPSAQSGISEMAVVPFIYPRMADSIRLLGETFHNLGNISNPAERDIAGQRMIAMQTKIKAQQAANWRKAGLIGALRGSLFVKKDGEDWNYSFSSSGAVEVSSQLEAANKAKLNMLGDGDILATSWGSPTTNINAHLDLINEGFQRKCGGALRTVICPSNVWSAVIANDFIRQGAGTSNAPFEMLKHEVPARLAGRAKNVKIARLNTHPQLTWYVTDEVVELNDGVQKIVPNGKAIFLGCEPDDGTVAMYEGSEPVAEYDGGPETVRTGFTTWSVKKSDPAATVVHFLDNAMPVIHVPNAVAYGDCIY
jgi:hypothetical protein